MTTPESAGAPRSARNWEPVNLASVIANDLSAKEGPPSAPSLEEDPNIGRLIGGKYRLLDRLGVGGMAVVYRAQEQGMLRREVAIKLLTPESALSQATIARFLKEAQAISVIGHANVVQLIELGRTDEGQIFLVMERLVGKTLYQVLWEMSQTGEVFTWPKLAIIILQICRALHAAHRQKIIHRDIKPGNIFCCDLEDDQWHIKVLDFGIAKVQRPPASDDSLETPLTQEGMFLGTPHYAAPEIIVQQPEHTIDGRVDIFALGVIMYQCLTGTLPFQALRYDRLAVMYKTTRESPEPPRQRAPERDIPPEVEAIVLRAMAIKVEDRFENITELMRAIRETFRDSFSGNSRPSILREGSSVESTPTPSVTPDQATPAAIAGKDGTPGSQRPTAPERSDVLAPDPGASARRPRARLSNQDRGAGVRIQPSPTPAAPASASTTPLSDSPTVQTPSRRAARGAVAAVVAMGGGLMVLIVLLVQEFLAAPPPMVPRASLPPPPPPGHVTPIDPSKPEVSPDDTPAEDPESTATRKQAIRDRLDAMAADPALRACLPPSGADVSLELPVLIEVDPGGSAKTSIPSRLVEHRVPKRADTCILQVLDSSSFTPGIEAVKVSHTLHFK